MVLGLTVTELVIVIIIFMTFFSLGVGIMVWFSQRWLWPFAAVIAESNGNETKITRRTRARLIGFGDGGEEIFLLKKPKKLRAAYGKRIGLRQILWTIGEDGLWYNTVLGDFNKKLLEVGMLPVERDVRLSGSSIRKGMERDYGNKSFFDKYGTVIQYGIMFIILVSFVGVMWFLFDQQKQISSANLEAMKLARDVLASVANLQSGGSGIVAQ